MEDWILANIKKILAEKRIKLETVSKDIGISKGEFSKILNGERKEYFKYLPQIADSIQVNFHQLVTPPNIVQENNDEVNDNGVNYTANEHQQYLI